MYRQNNTEHKLLVYLSDIGTSTKFTYVDLLFFPFMRKWLNDVKLKLLNTLLSGKTQSQREFDIICLSLYSVCVIRQILPKHQGGLQILSPSLPTV